MRAELDSKLPMAHTLRRSRWISLALTAVLLPGSLGILHAGAADLACDPAIATRLTAHDASAHGVRAPASRPLQPEHCDVCHFLRVLRPLAGSGVRQTAVPRASVPVRPAPERLSARLHDVRLPSRAPPA